MLAIPLYLILIIVTVWGFFSTSVAGWIFVSLIAISAIWILILSSSLKSKWISGLPEDAFTPYQMHVFKKYVFYFMFPFQAMQYSSAFTFSQLLCLIWAGLCIWKSEWFLLIGIISVFFATGNMAPFLNQGNFLRVHRSKGKLTPDLLERLEIVEEIEEKILKARGLQEL